MWQPAIGVLIAAIALFGVTVGIGMTAAYATAGGIIPHNARATGFGFLTSASLSGLALSPMASGFVAARSIRLVFAIDAILLALVAAVVVRAMSASFRVDGARHARGRRQRRGARRLRRIGKGIGMRRCVSVRFTSDDLLNRAGIVHAAIMRGEVIAYPTETFYGLGADPSNAAAIERIYAIKGRRAGEALPLIAQDVDVLVELGAPLPRARAPARGDVLARRAHAGAADRGRTISRRADRRRIDRRRSRAQSSRRARDRRDRRRPDHVHQRQSFGTATRLDR